MTLSLIRRLACLAALVTLIGGTAVTSSAQDDDVPKSKKKSPPKTDPDDDDVIVPGKKTKTPAAGAKSLPGLLKQANLKYETQENDDGSVVYKIPITVRDQKTTVFATELTMGKTDDGQAVKAVLLVTPVASFPSDYRPTIQLYKTISEYNDKYVFGKGVIGPHGAAYACPFWLRNADTQTLLDHLYLVHIGRLELKKRVQAVFEEE